MFTWHADYVNTIHKCIWIKALQIKQDALLSRMQDVFGVLAAFAGQVLALGLNTTFS